MPSTSSHSHRRPRVRAAGQERRPDRDLPRRQARAGVPQLRIKRTTYDYAGQDPINNYDLSGEWPCSLNPVCIYRTIKGADSSPLARSSVHPAVQVAKSATRHKTEIAIAVALAPVAAALADEAAAGEGLAIAARAVASGAGRTTTAVAAGARGYGPAVTIALGAANSAYNLTPRGLPSAVAWARFGYAFVRALVQELKR